MSWYQFKHLLGDLRGHRFPHDYSYTRRGSLVLGPIEMLVRRALCRQRGHRWPARVETKDGTVRLSWKTWCLCCFEPEGAA